MSFKDFRNYNQIVVISFLIVYAFSLSFVYVEGDDASTMAFHVLGRNAAIQPPYAAYQAMMDKILWMLPSNEKTLRIFGIAFTSAFSIIFCILLFELGFEWLAVRHPETRCYLAIVGLLAIPELFFFGLVYSPTIVGMSFILSAHLLIRHAHKKRLGTGLGARSYVAFFLLSLLLFGFGVSCRWSCSVYALVIVSDLVLIAPEPGLVLTKFLQNTLASLSWGILALPVVFLWIYVSGYGFAQVIAELGTAPPVPTQNQPLYTLARLQSVLTPATVVLLFAGLFVFPRNDWRILVLLLVSILSISPFLGRVLSDVGSGTPKFLIFLLPAFLTIVFRGALIAWNKTATLIRLPHWIRYVVLVLLIAPWLVGLKVYSQSLWGPGFQLTPAEKKIARSKYRFEPVFEGGMALPTPEGPRPLYGYAYVLTGQWRKLITEIDRQTKDVVDLAIASDQLILQDENNNKIVIELLSRGFKTRDPKFVKGEPFIARNFFDETGRKATLVGLRNRKDLYNEAVLEEIERKLNIREVLFVSGYTSTILNLHQEYPQATRPLGYYAMELNLQTLRENLKKGGRQGIFSPMK